MDFSSNSLKFLSPLFSFLGLGMAVIGFFIQGTDLMHSGWIYFGIGQVMQIQNVLKRI